MASPSTGLAVGQTVAAQQDLAQQAARSAPVLGSRVACTRRPRASQMTCEQAELRGRARAVDPFEHDEQGCAS